jgi:predicted branched-subunit amino acid permease
MLPAERKKTITTAPRLLLGLAALTLTPFGVQVVRAALSEPQPHLMVMLVFSGSLAALVGLAAAVGLTASLCSKTEEDIPKEEDPC